MDYSNKNDVFLINGRFNNGVFFDAGEHHSNNNLQNVRSADEVGPPTRIKAEISKLSNPKKAGLSFVIQNNSYNLPV